LSAAELPFTPSLAFVPLRSLPSALPTSYVLLAFCSPADFAKIADFMHEVLEECKEAQRKSGKKLVDFVK